MSNTLTVADIVAAGHKMNGVQSKIAEILDESGLSILHKISVLDMMAFELKYKAMRYHE